MTDLDMNASVNYLAIDDSITTSGTTFTWDYWRDWPEPAVKYFRYPVYAEKTMYEDTYKKAFKIAKLLLKKKLLVSRKLRDFIRLVEEIAKEL